MGLYAIDDQHIYHHCMNPDCINHNCANWESFQHCAAHDAVEYVMVPAAQMQQRMKDILPPDQLAKIGDTILEQPTTTGRRVGQTRAIPMNHPDIQFTGSDVVALPICTEILQTGDRAGQPCNTQMFLKVNFTASELNAPNIRQAIRDPANPTVITGIQVHPMVGRHQQLAAKLAAMGRKYTPPAGPPQPPPGKAA